MAKRRCGLEERAGLGQIPSGKRFLGIKKNPENACTGYKFHSFYCTNT